MLKEADVVIQVLDARDPLRCRSASLDAAVKDKKVLYVLNKIGACALPISTKHLISRRQHSDACPREAVQEWATTLRSQHPAVVFRSSSAFLPTLSESIGKGKGKERADDALGVDAVRRILGKWAQEKESDSPLAVAVVGVTNVRNSRYPFLPVVH